MVIISRVIIMIIVPYLDFHASIVIVVALSAIFESVNSAARPLPMISFPI